MDALNVLGGPLEACSFDPLTGFFRDGCCTTDAQDHGTHVVCAKVTADFLAYSLAPRSFFSSLFCIALRDQPGCCSVRPFDVVSRLILQG